MTIYWSDFARLKLREIFDFYKAEAGTHVARKLVSKLIDSTVLLEQNSEIGQREELLQNRTEDFRYLVHSHYKILYWIDSSANRIVIAHVFDCRQNPTKMSGF